jgi:putative membrane protein
MRISKLLTLGALLAGLAALFACDRRDDGNRTSRTRSGEPRSTDYRTPDGRSTAADTSWLAQAAEANLAEIETGRLAESKASNADVKQFGQHMAEDHQKANAQLGDLAKKKGMTLPTRPDDLHTKAAADLADLSGADFDRKYMDMMVTDHEKAVSLFESHTDASDADVKAFAEKTLPTLKHHLQMAKDVRGKLGTPKAD